MLVFFVPSRATMAVLAVDPRALQATTKSGRLVLARDEHVSRRNDTTCGECATPLTILAFVHSTHRSIDVRDQQRAEPSTRALLCRLRHFARAIAITAAPIASAAAVDLPEISLMNTLLLWDEGGIAFGDLTFRNRPLLGTATAIVVDCQFLNRDGQKVDQRKLTVEGPVYGRRSKLSGSELELSQRTLGRWLAR